MKNKLLAGLFLFLLLGSVSADNPPTFPTAFYGIITTASGTPNGQTLNAALGSSSASATVNPASVYSCGGSTCNYYLTISRASGDTSSTNVVFTLNSHNIGNGTFSAGAVVRLDFPSVPASNLNGGVIGSASDITAPGLGSVSLTINGSTPGTSYDTTLPVSIYDGGNLVVSFDFDFSSAFLNLSAINITNGTSGGKSYIAISGVNASGGQSGTKTVKLYGVSGSYNGICVKDSEGVSYISISSTCDGAGEVQAKCDGVAVSGITCSQSGSNLTISGLAHSALIQFSVPAGAGGGGSSGGGSSNSGGGGSSGGGGGASSTKTSSTYNVDAGSGNACPVKITREISSSSNLSTITTTLENTGSSAACSLSDFLFEDTLPSSLPAINEMTFNPAFSSRSGWKLRFSFPSFASGESKTLAYSYAGWIPPSRASNFTIYSMSAKKQAAPAPQQNVTPPAPVKPAPVPTVPATKPVEQPPAQAPAPPPAAPAPEMPQDALPTVLLIAMAIIIVATLVLVYLLIRKKEEY